MRLPALLLAAAVISACNAPASDAQPAGAVAGQPLETRPANVPDQKPAFPGQTRAPYATAHVSFDVRTVAQGLDNPWGMTFLPDGRILLTERPGRLRILGADGKLSEPITGLPAVDGRGQGGLLDVALDPAFKTNGLIYWTFSEAGDGGNGTAAARGKLTGGALTDVKVIWRQSPKIESTLHYAAVWPSPRTGTLFITTGERSILPGRMLAQKLDGTLGKVIRVTADGAVPKDNPFAVTAAVKREIWSYGHRNIQSAAINPWTGKLWTVEHGARGGDELNIPQAGKDYGWPTITYGEEYSGKPIGDGITQKAGMEQPVYYWDPVIAPSGMAFYNAALFPKWKGSLFIGGLKDKDLVRLTLKGDKVVGEERLLADQGQRIRDVRVGPDGAVYVLTDGDGGKLLKLVPKA